MPIAMQRNMAFMTLFGMNPNAKFKYDRYFQIMPNGAEPAIEFTKGFFDVAMEMNPKPRTVALVGADAEYPHAALEGARVNVKKRGLKIVYDKTYPPNTTDYAPIVRAIQATNPDVVYVASYPPDSAGMVRAVNEVGLKTKLFGGGMIGLQYAAFKTQLGALLNGVTSFELYAPEPTIKFPYIDEFLKKYQPRAAQEKLDPLGFYLPPYAYAMMQVLGEAVQKVGSLDQAKIAAYIHGHEFTTVVGSVKFAKNGEWAVGRPLYAQYRGIKTGALDEWKQPGRAVVVWPPAFKSGEFRYPFHENRK
jgi:branched-chain amino acid transport system substrate-binding protein